MGKSQSRPASSWSWSYKRRENPEGDSYILRGCINTRYRDSEEQIWMAEGSSDHVTGCKNGHGTQCGSREFAPRQAERHVGLNGDLCSLKVALPPEMTGSRCSLKVQAMQDDPTASPSKKTPHTCSRDDPNARGTIGAVDCDVSLDAEKETQEWAFTLYDFDGHRRITREDLSSILKSISEALACSVILPPSGSRKLKLRLSVVSDQEAESKASTGGGRGSQPGSPSRDNMSHQRSASTQSTSLPSTSPLSFPTPPFFGRQENKENALNRARDRAGAGLSAPANARHSFNVNHQCWRKDEKRSRRTRNRRSQSMAPADLPASYPEQASPDRHHHKTRKSNSTPDHGKTPTGSSKPTNSTGINCAQSERPQENAERRSYYQELAGIDHQCTPQDSDGESDVDADNLDNELPLGASANRTHTSHRHSRTSPHHHRRSKSYEPHSQGNKKQAMQLPNMNQEMLAKCIYAQRHHRDYHMQLLEASRSRLEGLQPHHTEPQPTKESPCRHSMKRHSFPATPVQVVTTQVVAPGSPPQAPAVKGKHRRKSRRHHHQQGLQPLTVMKHEVLEKTEGAVVPPATQKHQHHHHHEHHHHHHYHHYHDID